MDVLGGDDVARLHRPGRAGHGHGRLMIGREQGSTVSKTVKNGNKRGKGESLALGAHWWAGLGEELVGGEVELNDVKQLEHKRLVLQDERVA